MSVLDTFSRLPLQEARLRFKAGDYTVLAAGDYVCCAVSGQRIPLSEVRYWSVERQEAYAGPAQALKHFRPRHR